MPSMLTMMTCRSRVPNVDSTCNMDFKCLDVACSYSPAGGGHGLDAELIVCRKRYISVWRRRFATSTGLTSSSILTFYTSVIASSVV
jgi:hypothetical protein